MTSKYKTRDHGWSQYSLQNNRKELQRINHKEYRWYHQPNYFHSRTKTQIQETGHKITED